VTLSAQFSYQNRVLEPDGFYDGANQDGSSGVSIAFALCRIHPGNGIMSPKATCPNWMGNRASFTCVEPSEGNHGPVRVNNTFHFAYDDGTPFYSFGTTCYAWTHQGDELGRTNAGDLEEGSFNKVRMCVFPKDYIYNENEPVYYPFERDEKGQSDPTRFNPEFFRHFEQRVGQLCEWA
jgi:hypothetical protein